MRLYAPVSVLCATTATVLAFLCLFAGRKPNFLENADIMVLDISKLLQNQTGTESSDGSTNSTVADDHSWYSVHVLNYCEGNFASDGSRNVTGCSKGMAFFSFNPLDALQAEPAGPVNITLNGDMMDAMSNRKSAYRAMYFFLCMGIAATMIGVILGAVVTFLDTRRTPHGTTVSLINLGLAMTGFFGIGGSSSVITGVVVGAEQQINQHMDEAGLAASKGGLFFAMIWVATGLMLVATIVWVLDYFIERKIFKAEIQKMYTAHLMERNMRLRRETMEIEAYDFATYPVKSQAAPQDPAGPAKVGQDVAAHPSGKDTADIIQKDFGPVHR